MSQSPPDNTSTSSAGLQAYETAWTQLYELLQAGKSLSGRERHCAFLNLGQDGRFADVSAVSGLDAADDGRAVSIVDWDHDGDLDLWITGRTAPRARFFRNDCPPSSRSIQFHLEGVRCNRDAIGARLELQVGGPSPVTLVQTVRAGDGFLAQSSKWVHFGLGTEESIEQLVVRWPGSDEVEVIGDLEPGSRYRVVQGRGVVSKFEHSARAIDLDPAPLPTIPDLPTERLVVTGRLPLPDVSYRDADGRVTPLTLDTQQPLLVNLWASWCGPCLEELSSWSRDREKLARAGLKIVALRVDDLMQQPQARANGGDVLKQMGFPFASGVATRELVEAIDRFQSAFLDSKRPLPVPTSLLLDRQGCVVVVYKGRVETEQLLADVRLLDADAETIRSAALPFGGRWLSSPLRPDPVSVARAVAGGDPRRAAHYLERSLAYLETRNGTDLGCTGSQMAETYSAWGAILVEQGDVAASVKVNSRALEHDAENRRAHVNLGAAYYRLANWPQAISHFTAALHVQPADAELLVNRGLARMQLGEAASAGSDFRAALQLTPDDARAIYNLARTSIMTGDDQGAVRRLDHLLTLQPGLMEVAHDLAWVLATSPDADVRDGTRAVELATAVNRESGFGSARALATLAAALAESGDYPKALKTANDALEIARGQQDAALTALLETMIQRFQQQQPYHRSSRQPQ